MPEPRRKIDLKLLPAFVMFGLALPAFGQYAGPAILSRGEAPAAMTAPTVDFAFSLALTANYTNGLVGVVTNSQGQLLSQNSFGAGATVGLSGSHRWKHTSLGLAYSGSFYDYSSASYFAGISQGLSLGLTHQFSRHILFTLRESAGWYTLFPPSTANLNPSVPFDPSQSEIPTTDFYDNRTIYSTTQANVIIQATTRLSFSLGGGYFTNLRRSADLYSGSGEQGTGDVQYRLSRRVTVGGGYTFAHFGFSGGIGSSYIHTGDLSASVRFDRSTELSLFGGASRVSSSFEEVVPIDPAILAILCPPTLVTTCPLTGSTVLNHNIFWAPNFGIRLSRSLQRGTFYASAGEAITPGNGLFLTSRSETASAGYGYSGLRRWNLSIGVYYTKALSVGNIQGGYGQVTGFLGMSRRIVGQLSFVSSFNATKYQSDTFSAYNRLIYSASIGLGFSSKPIPVRFF
jgi:hypothetical protein